MKPIPMLVLLFCGSLAVAQTTSLSLEQVYAALPNSLEWQNADLTYQSSEQSLASAQASAGLTSNLGADGNLISGTTSTSTAITLKANASLAVLPWAAQFDQVRSAERALARANLDRRDSRNTLFVTATQQYFNARVAALDVENNQFSQNISAQQLQNAEEQFKNGQLSKDNLENIRRNFGNSNILVLQTQQNLELSRLQLWTTLTVTPTEAAFKTAPRTKTMPSSTPEQIVSSNLELRSDVQKARSRVTDAEDNLGIAQRERSIVSATVSAGVGQTGGANLNSSLNLNSGILSVSGAYPITGGNTTNPTNFTAGISLNIPITAPSSEGKIDNAKKSLEIAKATLETTRRNARLDVIQKYSDALLQNKRLELAVKTLENAKNSLETSKQRLALGTITALDVQSIELTMRQAARDLENQTVTQYISVLKFESAMGQVVGVQ